MLLNATQTPEGYRTIVTVEGSIHRWDGSVGCWQQLDQSDVETLLNEHLEHLIDHDFSVQQAEYDSLTEEEKKSKNPPVRPKPTRAMKADATSYLRTKSCAVVVAPAWLDSGKERPSAENVIAAPNGLWTIDGLAEGKNRFSTPTPAFFNTSALPFDIDRNAPSPQRWLGFLNDTFNGDQESIDLVQEVMGYFISGSMLAQVFFYFLGRPGSGKGTLLDVIAAIMGNSSIASPTIEQLADKFGQFPLMGKQLTCVRDFRLGSIDAKGKARLTELLNDLVGQNGTMTRQANRKCVDHVSGLFRTRFALASNDPLDLKDESGALVERMVLLHFPNSVRGTAKMNTGLEAELKPELPQILNWAIPGLVRLMANKWVFTPPAASRPYRVEAAERSSPLREFCRQKCNFEPGLTVVKDKVTEAFKAWCDEREGCRAGNTSFLFNEIRKLGHKIADGPRPHGGKRTVVGMDISVGSPGGSTDPTAHSDRYRPVKNRVEPTAEPTAEPTENRRKPVPRKTEPTEPTETKSLREGDKNRDNSHVESRSGDSVGSVGSASAISIWSSSMKPTARCFRSTRRSSNTSIHCSSG